MNRHKLIMQKICVALAFFMQSSTAWAYSDTAADQILGYSAAAVLTVFIFALCYWILKVKAKRVAAGLAQLKERDPGFNEALFLDDVAALYIKVMAAWCNRDLDPVRLCLAPEAVSYYNKLLEEDARKGSYRRLDELSLSKVDFMGVRTADGYDCIDVWITAKAKAYAVDSQGRVVAGAAGKLNTWDAKWTFNRTLNQVSSPGKTDRFGWRLVKVEKINTDTGSFDTSAD